MGTTKFISKPVSRVDGAAKVTGQARYAAEFNAEGAMLYGYVVSSPIGKGRIKAVDVSAASQQPGVVQVFTHENVPGLAWFDRSYKDQDAPQKGSPFRPLQRDEIQFSQQPIALVVAETFEAARYAAALIKFDFKVKEEELRIDIRENLDKAQKPKKHRIPPAKPRGDAGKAFEDAAVKVQQEYYHGNEHHNPMEMFASTVIYGDEGQLTIFDKTQGVLNSQEYIKNIFGLSTDKVRVISPFMGGGFGSGLRPQYQLYLAVLAALELKRSVKVVLTRQQMFSFGHRPATLQQISLGASAEGRLEAVINNAFSETSDFEEYTEDIVNWSGLLYKCNNVKLEHKVVPLDFYTPLDMRAPGGATGVYALEVAIDELAYKAGIDPLAMRMINYAEEDQNQGLPFSTKELRKCYLEGAARFGWDRRSPEPRSMREGHELVGWGVATGCWEAQQQPARAKALLTADGKLVVSSATADIGTGTYTSMTQVAADTLGMPLEDVTFKLGDTNFPLAPLQGGSWTMASIGTAVKQVCEAVKAALLKYAKKLDHSPLKGLNEDEVLFANGKIAPKDNPGSGIPYREVLRLSGKNAIEEETTAIPNPLKQKQFSGYTHAAVFVEVKIDEHLGTIRVTRVVNAIAAGKIINTKTAASQVMGGVVWGIGMALQEDSVADKRFGRFINHNLSEYHVPVNADINAIEVIFVEENDEIINPLGVKGVGEIGIVGTAAAISNAIYHATGKRLRSLPMHFDQLTDE